MHCHVEFHNAEGMALVIKEGEEEEMNDKPKNMQTCGNFYMPDDLYGHDTGEITHFITQEVIVDLVGTDGQGMHMGAGWFGEWGGKPLCTSLYQKWL